MSFENIPEKIRIQIIEPLIQFDIKEYKQIREFFKSEILKDNKKFFDILINNLDWFLELKNKYDLESALYSKFTDKYSQYFREYHNIIQSSIEIALNSDEIPESIKFEKLYDIYLESGEIKGYYYDAKFYQFRESIKETKNRIEYIIQKYLRIDPRGPTYINKINDFPHWSTLEFNLENGILCIFDFIENHRKIEHNHLYFRTIFRIDKKLRNAWQDGNPDDVKIMKKIMSEILTIKNIEIKSTYKIPEDFRRELFSHSIKEKFDYITNNEMRNEIERRYREINILESNEMYLLALILIGSILEQILQLYYNDNDSKFSNLIGKARKDKIISITDFDLLIMLSHLRNYIHIQAYLNSNDNINKNKYTTSYQIFEDLLCKFKKLINKTIK